MEQTNEELALIVSKRIGIDSKLITHFISSFSFEQNDESAHALHQAQWDHHED